MLEVNFDKRQLAVVLLAFVLWSVAIVLATNIFRDINDSGRVNQAEAEVEKLVDENNKLREEYEKASADYQTSLDEMTKSHNEEIETLKQENNALKDEIKKKEEQSLGQSSILYMYNTYIRLDDDCISNIINAVSKIDGTSIKAGGTFDFNEIAGPYSTSNGYTFIPKDANGSSSGDYSIGVEELVHSIYTCALNGGLAVKEYSLNNAGMAYVDNATNFKFENNTGRTCQISCKFNKGYLEVYIYA